MVPVSRQSHNPYCAAAKQASMKVSSRILFCSDVSDSTKLFDDIDTFLWAKLLEILPTDKTLTIVDVAYRCTFTPWCLI